MDGQKKTDEGFAGDSDLAIAVRLLEENGYYVVHADSGQHKCGGSAYGGYAGALLIQAYPKRTIRVELQPDRFVRV